MRSDCYSKINFQNCSPGAVDSPDEASFRQKIDAYLSDASWNAEGVRVVRRLLEYDAGSFMNFRSGRT